MLDLLPATFGIEKGKTLFKKIINNEPKYYLTGSNEVNSFIRKCLIKNPVERATLKELADDPWLNRAKRIDPTPKCFNLTLSMKGYSRRSEGILNKRVNIQTKPVTDTQNQTASFCRSTIVKPVQARNVSKTAIMAVKKNRKSLPSRISPVQDYPKDLISHSLCFALDQ